MASIFAPPKRPKWSPEVKRLIALRNRDPHAAQMLANLLICPGCIGRNVKYSWAETRGEARFIRVECARCGRFLKWAPQTLKNVRLADRQAHQRPQVHH